jgi:2-succinyl-5-enolpyruvyl-6-hydroxy-3-cyclohexene-1-carboxylate synthase
MQIDERSAGFRALGLSLATGRPAAVVTTSGSAVANLLPAVVEADRSLVPLVVITADRPAELVHLRANQTMDQPAVFSAFVRSQLILEAPSHRFDDNERWRGGVAQAFGATSGGRLPPGPVHINVAFREPTLPVGDDGRSTSDPYPFETGGADSNRPWHTFPEREERPLFELPSLGDHVVVAVGHGTFDQESLQLALGDAGVAVLATCRSGLHGDGVLRGYHHSLVDGFPSGLEPSGVVVIGDLNPADRIFRSIAAGTPTVFVDAWGVHTDPQDLMTVGLSVDPNAVIGRLGTQRADWKETWLDVDIRVRSSVRRFLEAETEMSGPRLASTLNSVDWDAIVVGSSLAIRDIDHHVDHPVRLFSNRGVSGIDGFVSTSLGVGTVFPKTLAYVGDLSFLHDANGFLGESLPPVVFVVVDNNGGGLFDLLPQSRLAPDFERLFVTPPHRDLALLAEFHGLGFVEANSHGDLLEAVDDGFSATRPTVVRVKVDRKHDVSVRSELDRLSRETLSAL